MQRDGILRKMLFREYPNVNEDKVQNMIYAYWE